MFSFLVTLVLTVTSFALALKVWRMLLSTDSDIGKEVLVVPVFLSVIYFFTEWILGSGTMVWAIEVLIFYFVVKTFLDLDPMEGFQLAGIWAITWLVQILTIASFGYSVLA